MKIDFKTLVKRTWDNPKCKSGLLIMVLGILAEYIIGKYVSGDKSMTYQMLGSFISMLGTLNVIRALIEAGNDDE